MPVTPPPALPALRFLDLGALDGRRPWTYAVGLVLVFGLTALLAVPVIGLLVLIGQWLGPGAAGPAALDSLGNALHLLALFTPHLLGLPILLVVLRRLHRRPLHTLWSPRAGIDGRLFLRSFGLSLAVIVAGLLVGLALDQETPLHWSIDPLRWVLALLLFGPLWLIQVSAEELLFRGYLSQGLMRLLPQPGLVALIVAGLFVPLHYNPAYPWWAYADLMLTSLMLSALTWRADRLEAAIGLHLANNLFLFAGIGNAGTGIVDQPLARIPGEDFGSPEGLLLSLLQFAVLYALLFGRSGTGLWRRETAPP